MHSFDCSNLEFDSRDALIKFDESGQIQIPPVLKINMKTGKISAVAYDYQRYGTPSPEIDGRVLVCCLPGNVDALELHDFVVERIVPEIKKGGKNLAGRLDTICESVPQIEYLVGAEHYLDGIFEHEGDDVVINVDSYTCRINNETSHDELMRIAIEIVDFAEPGVTIQGGSTSMYAALLDLL